MKLIPETRKKIIELISPYMDKTISPGCYIELLDGCSYEDYVYLEGSGFLYSDEYYQYQHGTIIDIYNSNFGENKNEFFHEERHELGLSIGGFERSSERVDIIKYITNYGSIKYCFHKNIGNIIGHYDITAVLKYIKNRDTIYFIHLEDDRFEITKIVELEEGTVGYFPNKPLHLYTDEEDKELLKILNKINNEN